MKTYLIPLLGTVLLAASCDDLLTRDPKDRLSPETFFHTEEECRLYTNDYYTLFPGGSSIFSETADIIIKNVLDNEVSGLRIPNATDSHWNFDALRDINFFLEHASQCSDEEVRSRYEALSRFFRAYFYFEKVKRFGDVPWLDHTLTATDDELYKGRDDRKEVMDHVLEDIDFAIKYLPREKAAYTVTRWTALALKSRIFLFEGTFRKYHGIEGWEPCLEECAAAAQELIQSGPYSLYTTGSTPYLDLFNAQDAVTDEVILARAYNSSLKLTHDVNGYFTSMSMGRSGLLQDVVDMYLMKDGSRFTDRPGFDRMSLVEASKDRDGRLAQTIRTPGYHRVGSTAAAAPDLSATMTGYQIVKYVGAAAYDAYNTSTSDLPLFRLAETYLNFAEAKAELGSLTQGDLDATVNRLRARAGVAALSLEQADADPDPYLLDPVTGYRNVTGPHRGVILEIRRERTVELICEGFRYWDIMRWKEGARFDRTFKGMWFDGAGSYDLDGNGTVDLTIYDGTAPAGDDGVVAYSLKEMNLSEGNRGHIIRFDDIERHWNEERDYLYPIPTDDIVLTHGAVKQNPGWVDGINF
ncbi:MAG: RagB/SusD family nutrient uptake outer membrane protein [Bacteroidales bacterium]|nr:RagB/SusD family nutrient uptake outer membrane protein [Bacteroidales bacterium]